MGEKQKKTKQCARHAVKRGGPGMRNPSATRLQGLGPAFLSPHAARMKKQKKIKKSKKGNPTTLNLRTRGRTRACERTVQEALSSAPGPESLWARGGKERSTAGKNKKKQTGWGTADKNKNV